MHVLLAQPFWAPRHSIQRSRPPRALNIQTTWDLGESIAPSLASLRPLTLQILPVRLLHFILGVQVCTASHQYFDRVDFNRVESPLPIYGKQKATRIVFTLVRSGCHSKKHKVQKITVSYITHSNAVCFFRWSEII